MTVLAFVVIAIRHDAQRLRSWFPDPSAPRQDSCADQPCDCGMPILCQFTIAFSGPSGSPSAWTGAAPPRRTAHRPWSCGRKRARAPPPCPGAHVSCPGVLMAASAADDPVAAIDGLLAAMEVAADKAIETALSPGAMRAAAVEQGAEPETVPQRPLPRRG
eukprot:14443058-Alexandrium_andersonii.AAC.1